MATDPLQSLDFQNQLFKRVLANKRILPYSLSNEAQQQGTIEQSTGNYELHPAFKTLNPVLGGIRALSDSLYTNKLNREERLKQLVPNPMTNPNETGLNNMPMYATGGIPERYKNMGFTRVGQKKQGDGKHKWKVLAKKGDSYKVVQGGWRGMQDFTQHRSEERRKRFWDRMGGKDSAKAKDPFSPLYWHKRFGTWATGGDVNNDEPSQEEVISYLMSLLQQQEPQDFNPLEDFAPESMEDYLVEEGEDPELLGYEMDEEEPMMAAFGLSAKKARKILHDKSVHGKPLTDKQRKFFGWMASKKQNGGYAVDDVVDLSMDEINALEEQGYKFEIL